MACQVASCGSHGVDSCTNSSESLRKGWVLSMTFRRVAYMATGNSPDYSRVALRLTQIVSSK
jgi:hypothetical protein